MLKSILLFSLLFFLLSFNAIHAQYSRVKVFATNAELTTLSAAGLAVDHGKAKANHWLITDLSNTDIDVLNALGFSYEILIDDVQKHYVDQNKSPQPLSGDRESCGGESGGDFDPTIPENFRRGTMGGYYTYEEYLAELDSMVSKYPDLITAKAPISDFESHEGRPIYWVKISDNPSIDEGEKEVLYNSIHHAREPMSLSQTIFYMWYLLENYGTDDEISYLVDNTAMFFVPMVNPDGYKYNHTRNPFGGGMHRKNRNPDIGSSNKGVDLNRNYDYHWNETGTSPDEDGDTYAGEHPFSEPETQAIKWFCENHNFLFASNAHTYGNLVLFPFGWSDDHFADDHDYYQLYTNHMTIYNGFQGQKSSELYEASGGSDDWMYDGDLDMHDAIFAITPEIGPSFWPAADLIEPTCKSMVFPNLRMAHLAHVYGATRDLEPSIIGPEKGYLAYEITRLGIEDGPISVALFPLIGIASVGDANEHILDRGEVKIDSINFTFTPGIRSGAEIKYILQTSNGLWTNNDTITKIYGETEIVFIDAFSDASNWIGDWETTDELFVSPSTSMTDSPYLLYSNNTNKSTILDASINLSDAATAFVYFNANWEIEADYDYVQFMASTDSGDSWIPLCGKYTNAGTIDQDYELPLYDGSSTGWVKEEVDLQVYLGFENVQLKFRIISDNYVTMDGFYFDDFNIVVTNSTDLSIDTKIEDYQLQVFPNPTSSILNYQITGSANVDEITITNNLGQTILKEGSNTGNSIDLNQLSNGIYIVRFQLNSAQIITKKIIVQSN
ncbi:M14 family zinc carboxypeptidase [Crocinitomix catalasitica]|uniref:M14 family zinc carboxypeptidase n=1 Tax=Crocinitomix catalasitica TaxID=184607 RepID=UPI000688E17D|nr:M14 family zinc carboxypeptidase [Crocinitomix catalasitica]